MTRIGFIGLGNMGGPMAAKLARAGHAVRVFDLMPESVAKAIAAGCIAAGDAREAASAIAERVPDLILLDLNLPKYDGRQLLEKVKSDADLCDIPIVVLTTSSAQEDIVRSYKLHANAYVTKPVDLDQFMKAVRQIDDFFVRVVRLPRF